MTSIDGLITTNNPNNFKYIQNYNKIYTDDKLNKELWIQNLKEQGIKAAHPNDGWVDRENNKIEFAYPHFNLSPKVGDLIMIGWHNEDDNILAKVTKIEEYKGIFREYKYYHFTKLITNNNKKSKKISLHG